MNRLSLFAVAVLGAVLGFTLEPLVGRLVTLAFGGAVHVWTVVVLVFQVVLLASYAWAHLVARAHPRVHALLALCSVYWLPFMLETTPSPQGALLDLAWVVLVAAGPLFFVTSSAAVVATAWWDHRDPPWMLYAASNAGSLGGLLAYPLVIEPHLGLQAQRTLWSVLYVVFVVLVVRVALVVPGRERAVVVRPEGWTLGIWLGTSAAASWLSLAVTGWIGTEFGSFPLLWILPLGLYLGSFMLAFHEGVAGWLDRSGLRGFWLDALVVLGLFACMANEPLLHPVLYGAFFGVCWALHAALFRHRPSPEGSTGYFLAIAAGGALGSAVVTVVAPLGFPGLWEFPLGLLAAALALMLAGERVDLGWFRRVHWRFGVVRGVLVPMMLVMTLFWMGSQASRETLARSRSLYGVFTVLQRTGEDGSRHRVLMHGGTTHGVQYDVSDPRHAVPMAYYHPSGANAVGMGLRRGGAMGVVGLGAGAAAAWKRPGETIVFYEIDPESEALARDWFTFLSPEDEVRIGDARLVIAEETTVYDALFVDAFSGDGIPAHLMTEEAFSLWMDHLTPEGIVVMHLSNRFLDLTGVVRANVLDLGLAGAIRTEQAGSSADPLAFIARSAVVVRDPARLEALGPDWVRFAPDDGLPVQEPWTDDRQNVLQVLLGP